MGNLTIDEFRQQMDSHMIFEAFRAHLSEAFNQLVTTSYKLTQLHESYDQVINPIANQLSFANQVTIDEYTEAMRKFNVSIQVNLNPNIGRFHKQVVSALLILRHHSLKTKIADLDFASITPSEVIRHLQNTHTKTDAIDKMLNNDNTAMQSQPIQTKFDIPYNEMLVYRYFEMALQLEHNYTLLLDELES